jgi:uncharacterized membrane protein
MLRFSPSQCTITILGNSLKLNFYCLQKKLLIKISHIALCAQIGRNVMDGRAASYFGVLSVAWAALSLLQLIGHNTAHYVPFSSVLVAIFSGLIVSTVVSVVFSQRQLRVLAAKGETRTHFVTLLFIIGAMLIALGVLLLVVGESPETLLIMLNFASPMVPVFFGVQAFMFAKWEQTHKRAILFKSSIVSSKLYVFPKMGNSAAQ